MAARKKRKQSAHKKSGGARLSQPRTAPAGASKFAWRKPQADAALLLAEDELTDREIAAKVGVDPGQIWRWNRHPEFAARVKKHVEELGECARRYAIARKNRRVKALDDRWERLRRVIEARAAAPEMQDAPGGKTGLLVRQIKAVKAWEADGPDAEDTDCVPTKETRLVEHFAVDTGLLRELREHEHQAAVELGEWVTKIAPTTPDGTDEFRSFDSADRASLVAAVLSRLGAGGAAAPGDGPADSR